VPTLDAAADFGDLAAIATEHDDFIALFDGLDQLRQARLASCMLTVIMLSSSS
jgi:hypothetical protein